MSEPAVTLLQVEPTTRCNYRCGFCCGRRMDQSDLPFGDFEKALDALPDLERVELHGEGEPTLHPRFGDMVRLARDRGAAVSAITNGSLLRGERLEAILELDALFVSIESAVAEEFGAIRGGRLADVEDGIRRLLRLRRERDRTRPTVGFSVTVLQRTRDALPGIVRLYRELAMDGGISLHMLNTMPGYLGTYRDGMEDEVLSPGEQALAWARYRRATRAEDLRGATRHFSDEVFGQTVGPAAGRSGAREYRSCVWLDRGLFLNRHAATSGCARIKDTGRFGFGKVGERPLEEILAARDRDARRLRGGVVPPACEGCFVAESVRTRMDNLLERSLRRPERPRRPALAPTAPIGHVPPDPEAEAILRRHVDGGLSSCRQLLAAAGVEGGADPAAARVRFLPILGELVRRGELLVEA